MAALLALCGCSWIGRQADALGEYMPVIGDRCEHWQCITASGRAQSEANKAQAQQAAAPAASVTPTTPPAPAP